MQRTIDHSAAELPDLDGFKHELNVALDELAERYPAGIPGATQLRGEDPGEVLKREKERVSSGNMSHIRYALLTALSELDEERNSGQPIALAEEEQFQRWERLSGELDRLPDQL